MKTHYSVTLAMLAGFGLGAVAVEGLHAQAKPPVYQVVEIEPSNMEAYVKDYVPSKLIAIQRPSKTSCRSATAWRSSAPTPLRGYLNSCSDNRRAGLKAA